MNRHPRIALAANRMIGLRALRLLLDFGLRPVVMLVPRGKHVDDDLLQSFRQALPDVEWLRGTSFRSPEGVARLRALDLDYLLSVHFPYLIPREVLDTLRVGALNLHPSFLPYNRGWHTPSWAILDETPYGATLHWMDEGLDSGDVAIQRRVGILPSDTADSLYGRVLETEIEILRDALPNLLNNSVPRVPQRGVGSEHVKADLENMRRLHLHERTTVEELLRRIRALTTNRAEEAAWFEVNGERFLVQLSIRRDPNYEAPAFHVRRAA